MALRLVRATGAGVGSVSPELRLAVPAPGETVRATPDAVVVGAPADMPDWHGAAGTSTPSTTAYDTRDLLLERHGLKLELLTHGRARTWRLTAARGEVVETTTAGAGGPPETQPPLRNRVAGPGVAPGPAPQPR